MYMFIPDLSMERSYFSMDLWNTKNIAISIIRVEKLTNGAKQCFFTHETYLEKKWNRQNDKII